jgi:hypothetical protein
VQLILPKGDESKVGTVIRRQVDEDGNPTGRSNPNPILDTYKCEVEFDDRTVLVYSANETAEHHYSQLDAEY